MRSNRETPRGLIRDLARILLVILMVPCLPVLAVLPFALNQDATRPYTAPVLGADPDLEVAVEVDLDPDFFESQALSFAWRSVWRDWRAEWNLPVAWIQASILESNAAAASASRRTKAASDLEYWSRIYREAADRNRERVRPFARGFEAMASEHDLTRQATLELVTAFVQNFEYAVPENYLQLYPPPRLLKLGRGDCDSRALFLALVLEEMGFDAVMLLSPRYRHAMTGVVCEGCSGAVHRSLDGRAYRFVETTARTPPGFLHPAVGELSFWHSLKL
ncbi:MAG: hypothetical protein NXI24_14680 [bacterium]|nr:hypothetical protein [bacterium]